MSILATLFNASFENFRAGLSKRVIFCFACCCMPTKCCSLWFVPCQSKRMNIPSIIFVGEKRLHAFYLWITFWSVWILMPHFFIRLSNFGFFARARPSPLNILLDYPDAHLLAHYCPTDRKERERLVKFVFSSKARFDFVKKRREGETVNTTVLVQGASSVMVVPWWLPSTSTAVRSRGDVCGDGDDADDDGSDYDVHP